MMALTLSAFACAAWAGPAGLTLQGRLVKDGRAVENVVDVTIKITNVAVPGVTPECVLFEEKHTVNLVGSDGLMTVKIGGGARTVNDEGLSLVSVFSNNGTAISNLTCAGTPAATAYTPQAGESRNIYVSFVDNGETVAFSSPYVIQSVPYALEAERLAGKSASDFLQVTTNTTQTKLNDIMAPAPYAELLALLNGTSTQFLSASASNFTPTSAVNFNAQNITNASGVTLNGAADRTIAMVRQTTADTAGNQLTVAASGAASGATDKAGGNLVLASGTSTGSGSSAIEFQTSGGDVAGTNDVAPSTKMTILGNGNVGIGTAAPASPLHVGKDITATANHGMVSIGAGPFDGTSAGKYAGSANGTAIALNAESGFWGDLLNLQVAGKSKFRVYMGGGASGVMSTTGGYFGWINAGNIYSSNGINLQSISFTSAKTALSMVGGTVSNSTGSFIGLKIAPTYNQSGTAAATDLLINRSETAVGSGVQYLIDAQVQGDSRFTLNNIGEAYVYGNVGIGNPSPTYKLDVTGDLRITGTPYRDGGDVSWTVPSDARLKDVTGDFTRGLSEIANIDTIKFRYKAGNAKSISNEVEYTGVIAQQVQEQIPEAVKEDKDGFLSLNTTPIFWAMINAIKDLYHEVLDMKENDTNQNREIATLKADNAAKDQEIIGLKQENLAIKAYLCGKDPSAVICN